MINQLFGHTTIPTGTHVQLNSQLEDVKHAYDHKMPAGACNLVISEYISYALIPFTLKISHRKVPAIFYIATGEKRQKIGWLILKIDGLS